MLVKNNPFSITRPRGVARPYLFITIKNPDNNQELSVYALLDTGADECAFPASFASALGHDLARGPEKRVGTGNGATIAYTHTVCIQAGNFSTENVIVDFMPNLNTPLLGVKSFLSNFQLVIDYPNKQFSIL